MYTPNDDLKRQSQRDLRRYGPPGYDSSGSTRGGLVALLVLVVLIGGLIAYSTLSGAPVDENGNLTDTTAPQSITSGSAEPAAPAE